MTAIENPERIWLLPQKYWAATKGVPQEEVDRLMEELMKLAETRNFERLRRYDFISIGRPYANRRAS
jgi:hypothetical protein